MFFLKFVFSKQLEINIEMEVFCIASGRNNNHKRERKIDSYFFVRNFPLW